MRRRFPSSFQIPPPPPTPRLGPVFPISTESTAATVISSFRSFCVDFYWSSRH
jgi:hypothetical protein